MAKSEDELLRSVTKWRSKPKRSSAKLGIETGLYMEKREDIAVKNAKIVDVWESLLPENLLGQCKISEIKSGVLGIKVQPGVYMHEFRTVKMDFLNRLLGLCPGCGIKQITLSV